MCRLSFLLATCSRLLQDNNNGTYVFTLTINGVEKQDFGNYKFEIQNSHDITEVKIKLQEGKPCLTL